MLQQLIHVNIAFKPVFIEDMGDYNTLPKPVIAEISSQEFWKYFMTYSPVFIEFRQVKKPEHLTTHDAKIFWYHDRALAVLETEPGSVSFYRVGCKHDYVDTKIGHCLCRRVCNLCGWTTEIDSSG